MHTLEKLFVCILLFFGRGRGCGGKATVKANDFPRMSSAVFGGAILRQKSSIQGFKGRDFLHSMRKHNLSLGGMDTQNGRAHSATTPHV